MGKKVIVKVGMAILLLVGIGALPACNTIGGAGKDVSAVGKGVTSGAKTTGDRM